MWYLRGFLPSDSTKCCKLQHFVRCLCSIFKRAMLSHVLGILPQETTLQIELDDSVTRKKAGGRRRTEAFTHTGAFYTEKSLQKGAFYTQKVLHREVFTPRSFCTQTSPSFTHRSFCMKKSLRRGFFTRRRVCTQKLLHREAFRQRSFYTQKRLHTASFYIHRGFYTEKPLHRGAFYTQKVLRREVFTLRSFCTQTSWSF